MVSGSDRAKCSSPLLLLLPLLLCNLLCRPTPAEALYNASQAAAVSLMLLYLVCAWHLVQAERISEHMPSRLLQRRTDHVLVVAYSECIACI
jgi:hypothetical protein